MESKQDYTLDKAAAIEAENLSEIDMYYQRPVYVNQEDLHIPFVYPFTGKFLKEELDNIVSILSNEVFIEKTSSKLSNDLEWIRSCMSFWCQSTRD